MTLNLTITQPIHTDFTPRITVVGVGGGGTNAVNNMIAMGLDGVDFVVANTDAQSLARAKAERRIQLGPHLTQGLGAGGKPEIGRGAAEEAAEELARHMDGTHMVFVTAGMGGGTGTGAAPIIARMARERNILTVGVVTKPFDFEGIKRRRAADAGIEDLQQFVDTLIVIPNQNLFRLANEKTTYMEAFKMADQVLYMGVRGVTDLMVNPGVVNLDFNDIRAVMAEMGKAMMGTGEADGDDRAIRAAEAAISNPLLEDTSMKGAKGVLINIAGGLDLTLFEVDAAANRIRSEVDEDANIIFGSSIDEAMNGRIRVSVVATGIAAAAMEQPRPKLVAVGGGGAVASAPAPAVASAPTPAPVTQLRPVAAVAQAPAAVAVAAPVTTPAPAVVAEVAEPAVPPAPVMAPAPEVVARTERVIETAPPAPAEELSPIRSRLFGIATGLIRRPPTAPAPVQAPPPRVEPALQAVTEPAASAPRRAPAADEMSLEIPTFLRRQTN